MLGVKRTWPNPRLRLVWAAFLILVLGLAFVEQPNVVKYDQWLVQRSRCPVPNAVKVLEQSRSPQQFTSFPMDFGNKKRPPPTVKLSKWPLAVNPSEKFMV
jgi:hypothetical protein